MQGTRGYSGNNHTFGPVLEEEALWLTERRWALTPAPLPESRDLEHVTALSGLGFPICHG